MHIPIPTCTDIGHRGGRTVTKDKESTFRGVGLAYLVEKEPELYWNNGGRAENDLANSEL